MELGKYVIKVMAIDTTNKTVRFRVAVKENIKTGEVTYEIKFGQIAERQIRYRQAIEGDLVKALKEGKVISVQIDDNVMSRIL